MNILIAGASGFIGRELVNALKTNHTITALGRNQKHLQQFIKKNLTICTWQELANLKAATFDVIINLCGYNISAKRWSPRVKKQIIDSRVQTTNALVNWAINQNAKPRFFCANAVGIYGLQEEGDENSFDEDTMIDFSHLLDFSNQICICWQSALQPAIDYGMQVTTMRFGVVLKKGEGMLKKLSPSFYFGLGAVIGNGKQIISWVHIEDLIGAIIFLLESPQLTGAFNITSPNPVSQKIFAYTLAKIMHRPCFLRMPAFMIRALFGEMGECLLLKGQRVLPKRLLKAGYIFHYPELDDALMHEFGP